MKDSLSACSYAPQIQVRLLFRVASRLTMNDNALRITRRSVRILSEKTSDLARQILRQFTILAIILVSRSISTSEPLRLPHDIVGVCS
ncbi:hypothetical protein VTO42DRAFT_3686 [Malbranchea cinnamomea]